MPAHHARWVPLTALSLALTLAGCVVMPGGPVAPTGEKPGQATGGTKPGTGVKPAPDLKTKPKAGDAAALDKLKNSGRVQIAFKGLTPSKAAAAAQAAGAVVAKPGGGMVSSNGASLRKPFQLLQTTAEIARVEITLTSAKGFSQTQSLTRTQLMAPWVTMFFEAVPVGETSLTAKVYDFAGSPIGNGTQTFTVKRGEVTEVALNVKLAAMGGVGATISFEDVDVEEANITGHWVVGGGDSPPPYPMSGCGEGYVWSVNQYGDSLQASVKGYNDESNPDEKHRNMYWSEEAYGTIHKNEVRLSGRVIYTDDQGNMAAPIEEVEYKLTFDPNIWRLTGTRNDQPGWAVPYIMEPGCGEPPVMPMPMPMPSAIPSWGPYPYETPAPAKPYVRVRGTIWSNATGGAVPGAQVWFYSMDEQKPWSASTVVGPDGTYELAGVPVQTLINVYATGPDGNGSSDGYTQFFGYDSDAWESYDIWLSQGCEVMVADEGVTYCATPAPSWEPTSGPYPMTPAPSWEPTSGPYPMTPAPSWTPTSGPYPWPSEPPATPTP
ncbi:MAG: carboxypeptidase-like regulatory domain-containing protein [Candidatus Sericytochromatia bacterium]|nr:carboxypeptidase-like regulatory domain-containing protein [Candidatus Sericytochromatia bacterium]